MNRLILFLIRKRLGVKKNECFSFNNQKRKKDLYMITGSRVVKLEKFNSYYIECDSHLQLNYLLSDEAKKRIEKKGVIYGRLPILR